MLVELALSIVVSIFEWKDDIVNCPCYGALKPLERGMNVVGKVLEKSNITVVTVNEMRFGFMPERGTIDSVFILRWLQEEYQ